jgi:hypothetical protein
LLRPSFVTVSKKKEPINDKNDEKNPDSSLVEK